MQTELVKVETHDRDRTAVIKSSICRLPQITSEEWGKIIPLQYFVVYIKIEAKTEI